MERRKERLEPMESEIVLPTSVNAWPHERLFLSPETEAGNPEGADVSAAMRKRLGKDFSTGTGRPTPPGRSQNLIWLRPLSGLQEPAPLSRQKAGGSR